MGNVISSFLPSGTLGSIFSFVAGEAKYVWGLKGNLHALQTEFDKLIQTRDDLRNQVELAEQQPRSRRTNQVNGWLQRVDQLETKVAELRKVRDQEIDRLCLGGFCSNDLISSYDFGKRVEKLKEEVMASIKERGDIQVVSQTIPEAAAVLLPVDQPAIIGQVSIFDQVWRCIEEEDNRVGVIGLYGTGGVGKTTLLKRLNNNFRSVQHDFNVVIWSVVSREPNLKKIQEDIGKRIGLSTDTWKEKSLEDKALDISNILSQKKFVLLLDDIWKPVDLTALGVPLQRSNTSSKIVFTTRSSVVCGQMQATKKLSVSSLKPDEAWKLFQEVVGRDVLDSHSGIPQQAEILARECGGLPLALITLGRTMASKTALEQWEDAIIDLRALDYEFSDMEEKVYSRLKYSYDNLPPDNKIKSCLLYCSLFPEDYRIPKEELVNYWVSEGLVDDIRKGSKNIYHLLHSCLLEEDGDDHVQMHDVIRDMALWISRKFSEEEKFLVRAGVRVTEAPKREEWKEVERISLMENEIEILTEIPTCPRLQTLLLDDNEIMKIIGGFFQFMPSLKVLSLRGNYSLNELPSGISSLVSLQHLDLSRTLIHGLPQELQALMNLRYLNLDYMYKLSRIPQQLISSFSKLEVLTMFECDSVGLYEEEGNILSTDAESLIKELLCLEHLNLISLTLNSLCAVQNLMKSPKLLSITRSLSIQFRESLPLINFLHLASTEHLKELHLYGNKLEELRIDSAIEIEKVLQSGFRSLHEVSLLFCFNVKELTWLFFAQNLKKVYISGCVDVEEIVSAEKLSEVSKRMGELNFFAQLEILQIAGLQNLKSIYTNPLPFPQLKIIEVLECPKLKKLPLNSSSAKERQIVIEGEKEWWEELQWEDQATQNAFSVCFAPHY